VGLRVNVVPDEMNPWPDVRSYYISLTSTIESDSSDDILLQTNDDRITSPWPDVRAYYINDLPNVRRL
jgi:hypothetical protein